MAVRTGKVILSKNILLDKDHKNILDYTEANMITLLNSNSHLVASYTNCSFVRQGENKIDVPTTYGTALQCNYLAFQNPDYSNKWFFAFIDSVEYRSDKMTRITFTVDDVATWYDNWTPRACYVIREHTNDDSFGSNLIPENLELGDYVVNGDIVNFDLFGVSTNKTWIVVNATYSPDQVKVGATAIGGIPMGGGIFVFENATTFYSALDSWAQHSQLDSINMVYYLPYNFFDPLTLQVHNQNDANTRYYTFLGSTAPREFTATFLTPTRLNGYKPDNNKLWTAPYQILMVTNNNGSTTNYNYEYFTTPAACVLVCKLIPTVGGSLMVYPRNYKGIGENYNESIMGGKWPTLSWSGDAYTNWLTQNSVNIGMGVVNSIAGLFAIEKPLDIMGPVNTIANQVSQVYQHSLVAQTTKGNVNGGDVLSALEANQPYCYYMSIRADQAERIDDYFTRYGYKTNKIKVPNQTGRPYWNYVQIAEDDVIGYSNNTISVPVNAMNNINSVYRAGVTIWHDHANIGNYSLDNKLVPPSNNS